MDERLSQLPLALQLRDEASFDNFYINSDSQGIVHYLQQFLSDHQEWLVYLWGGHGVGKSHLLQACCHAMKKPSMYLPLNEVKLLTPAVLEGMQEIPLLCIDDLQHVMGQAEWEQKLFNLYNEMQALGNKLILSANAAPNELAIQLPDLRSRLTASVIFHLPPLNDEDKLAALQLRALQRGINLTVEVGHYLLNHYPRDMHILFATLDKLDNLSLVAKRRLTIPFIKKILAT